MRRAGLMQAVESYRLWSEGPGFKSRPSHIAQVRVRLATDTLPQTPHWVRPFTCRMQRCEIGVKLFDSSLEVTTHTRRTTKGDHIGIHHLLFWFIPSCWICYLVPHHCTLYLGGSKGNFTIRYYYWRCFKVPPEKFVLFALCRCFMPSLHFSPVP